MMAVSHHPLLPIVCSTHSATDTEVKALCFSYQSQANHLHLCCLCRLKLYSIDESTETAEVVVVPVDHNPSLREARRKMGRGMPPPTDRGTVLPMVCLSEVIILRLGLASYVI